MKYTLNLLRESADGLYPRGTKVMVHIGQGKVRHGEYIRKGERFHHVKIDGETHAVKQDDIAHPTSGTWDWEKKK